MRVYVIHEIFNDKPIAEFVVVAACPNDAMDRLRESTSLPRDSLRHVRRYENKMGVISSRQIVEIKK